MRIAPSSRQADFPLPYTTGVSASLRPSWGNVHPSAMFSFRHSALVVRFGAGLVFPFRRNNKNSGSFRFTLLTQCQRVNSLCSSKSGGDAIVAANVKRPDPLHPRGIQNHLKSKEPSHGRNTSIALPH